MMVILDDLFALIESRKVAAPTTSYTVTLLNDKNKAAQKVGEEAVEVIVAALGQSKERLIEESADLFYHLLVLLAGCDVTLDEVAAELGRRQK